MTHDCFFNDDDDVVCVVCFKMGSDSLLYFDHLKSELDDAIQKTFSRYPSSVR